MREWLGGLGLAVLLCAGAAGAKEPTAVVAPVPVPATPEGVEAPSKPGFVAVQSHAESEEEGGLRVSVMSGVLRSARAFIPLEVVLHNEGVTPRTVRKIGRAHV